MLGTVLLALAVGACGASSQEASAPVALEIEESGGEPDHDEGEVLLRFHDSALRSDAERVAEAMGLSVVETAFQATVVDAESRSDVSLEQLRVLEGSRGIRSVELVRWIDVIEAAGDYPPGSVCFARSRRLDRVVIEFNEGTDWHRVTRLLDSHDLTLRKADRSPQTVLARAPSVRRALAEAEAEPLVAYGALIASKPLAVIVTGEVPPPLGTPPATAPQ